MGCDIHLYKEKKVNGVWVTADEWSSYDYGDDDKGVEVPWKKRFTDRNYDLFGLLSKGVRREHPFSFQERGLPNDMSEEMRLEYDRYGSDGHSHSYLYLHELKDMMDYLKTTTIKISGMKSSDELSKFYDSIASESPDWDLLYPYCQSTNAAGYVDFEIDVPATFGVGVGLQKIINGFDGIDGDNHRIVFFFDN